MPSMPQSLPKAITTLPAFDFRVVDRPQDIDQSRILVDARGGEKLLRRDETQAEGDLLRAGDAQALALLDELHERAASINEVCVPVSSQA
jgi:hypothetical protein